MKSILAHIRKERRVGEQKLLKLRWDLSSLDDAARGVDRR
jgi:hypothetical protein